MLWDPRKARNDAAHLDVYLFGSILQDVVTVSDIDVLVVYRVGDDIASLKGGLTTLAARFPLHITYMSEIEEREFDFISMQGAQLLDDL